MDRSLPVFIKILYDIRDLDKEGGQLINDSIVVMVLYNHMEEMGVVDCNVRTWENTPEAKQTFVNIKEYFKIAWRRYRNDQNTTNASGFHSVNAA